MITPLALCLTAVMAFLCPLRYRYWIKSVAGVIVSSANIDAFNLYAGERGFYLRARRRRDGRVIEFRDITITRPVGSPDFLESVLYTDRVGMLYVLADLKRHKPTTDEEFQKVVYSAVKRGYNTSIKEIYQLSRGK